MTEISKEPASGVSEEKRKTILTAVGYGLRKNERIGKFCAFRRRKIKKNKKFLKK